MPAESTVFTDEQNEAIKTRDVSVALAAGAGCGKTFVLTERFVSYLSPDGPDALDPDNLREIVAITFTDAAAREMRQRIRQKCFDELQRASDGRQADWWLRLMRAMETARVSTIHSFCTALLRTHAVEAGLDPMFEVLDQSEADVLQSEIIDDVLREDLRDQRDESMHLAAVFDLGHLKNMVRQVLQSVQRDQFEGWLERTPADVVRIWQEFAENDLPAVAARQIAESRAAGEVRQILFQQGPDTAAFQRAREEVLDALSELADGKYSQECLDGILSNAKVQGICPAKDWQDAVLFKRYQKACESLRKKVRDIGKFNIGDDAHQAAELGLSLLELCQRIREAYDREKSDRGRLDFDDLLRLAHSLLTDPEHQSLRDRLSSDIRLLLVDEFQDTDKLQVEIVRALCGNMIDQGRLFFVGDHKQSIYRFRGAEPAVFEQLRSAIPKPGRLPLTMNFRSQPAILDFVNALFCDTFSDYQPLRPNRPQITAEPAVEFLWEITPNKNSLTKGTMEQARRLEAQRIARRLKSLLEHKEPIIADGRGGNGQEKRPLELGDVAILFRALSDVRYYEEALREHGLDYYLVGGHAFYAQQEIFDVLNLLRSVASPADEVSLAGVLRSPFFSLADETLFWMVHSAGSLNAALEAARLPCELPDAEQQKWRSAADTLFHLRNLKDRVPIATLINEALARTGFDAALLAEFLGERKLANLQKLMEQARAADRGTLPDLDDFIVQLSEFTARQPKEALAATCPETANVVRLMTIHRAKGLEFPLVVLVDLDRKEYASRDSAVFDPQLGPLVNPPQSNGTTGLDLYKMKDAAEEAEESKRLLYVACTRAADYLILSSSIAGHDEPQGNWTRLLAERFDLESGALRASLPEGLLPPKIHVVDEKVDAEWKPVSRTRRADLLKIVEETEQMAAGEAGLVPPHVGPIPVDRAAQRRFSFTGLSGELVEVHDTTDAREEVAGASNDGVDARELGRLVHSVLEQANLDDDASLESRCQAMAARLAVANPTVAARLAHEMTRRFFQSDRAQQLLQARRIEREIEFLLAWPPGDESAERYIHGFVDCLYEDPAGRWRLLDYKTNDVTAADCATLARRYEMQMQVYALAAEQALGESPTELVLSFLRPGVEHVVPWDDPVRREAVATVNQAIAKLLQSDT